MSPVSWRYTGESAANAEQIRATYDISAGEGQPLFLAVPMAAVLEPGLLEDPEAQEAPEGACQGHRRAVVVHAEEQTRSCETETEAASHSFPVEAEQRTGPAGAGVGAWLD